MILQGTFSCPMVTLHGRHFLSCVECGFALQQAAAAIGFRQGVYWLWPATVRSSSDFPAQHGVCGVAGPGSASPVEVC